MDSHKPQQNAWGETSTKPLETMSFTEIMSEEYAHRVHNQEQKRFEDRLLQQANQESTDADIAASLNAQPHLYSTVANPPTPVNQEKQSQEEEWEDHAALLTDPQEDTIGCDSDAVIAEMLQSQYDHGYNEELRRIENKRNKDSKVTVTLEKFRRNGDLEFLNDANEDLEIDDETRGHKRDWDRFETNEKMLDAIPKRGFKMDKEGTITTKHDPQLCGVRNACRVMSFPPEFPTGDGAGFDMKLSNPVFNQLKTYSRRGYKKNKMHDRKANRATTEMCFDEPTRLLLYKLINNRVLERVNGIISTGKEAVLIHANSDPTYADYADVPSGITKTICSPHLLPKECAIKIFKTALSEFKQRDRYIKDDYRFKDRFSKQNNRVVINMWAEKEMHNIKRMQSVGINCPDVVYLKKHVLVMSFIGDNHNAAPKLKNARLSESKLSDVYEEIVATMYKLYNEAKLIHADLSEYNILWYDNKCWIIDVAQSVEPDHPSALEFLMRDCANIINFFKKRGLPNIYTKEQLFEYITSLNAETHNVAMLERIHTRGASIAEATDPYQELCPDEQKPIVYPFDLAWEKSLRDRQQQKSNECESESESEVLKINNPDVEQANKS